VPELSSVTGMRRTYGRGSLLEADLAPDWVTQFTRWYGDAEASELILEPNAMVVATADPSGQPSVRTVLLRGVSAGGFVFFTNYGSRKGRELAANPQVSLLFPWVPLERQVIVTGRAAQVSRAESEEYFHSRPRDSQLASAASTQSAVWGGFRVAPDAVEFWQGRPARLHDRLRYRLAAPPSDWVVERLSP
jgi:pyridoxamine 5'-phosphate oxidase